MNDIIALLGVLTAISTYFISILNSEYDKIDRKIKNTELKSKIMKVGFKYFFTAVLMNILLFLVTTIKICHATIEEVYDLNTVFPFIFLLDCYILLLCLLSINELIKIIKEYKS
jgi:hypothetical protein